LVLVAYAYNPATQKVEIGRISAPGQKVLETSFHQRKLSVVAHICHPRHTRMHKKNDCGPKKQDYVSKITRAKELQA
jgi:hypothetical protein